jgi:hypothetical protein
MPEFQLDGEDSRFDALDDFTKGYVECLFFCEEGKDGVPNDVSALSDDSWQDIVSDCERFQKEHAALLERAYLCPRYEPVQAGRDFWFTRNGHGVGFSDRDKLIGDVADELQDTCGWKTNYPERSVYVGDDGKVYVTHG